VRITLKFNFVRFPDRQFRLNQHSNTNPPNLLPRSDLALLCHDLQHVSNTHYSRNSSTAPLPLIPRRLAPLPGSRRLSTLIAPHVDPPSSGVILTRARPPTTPDLSDSVSTLVGVLLPTPTSATEAEPSSTTSLPSTPHSSPSESVSQAVPPRRVCGQHFPAVCSPEQSTPTPAKADLRDDTPFTPRQSPAVISSRNLSEPHVHPLAAVAVARSERMPLFPRKQSGEPPSRPSRRSAHLAEAS
jgi:hypothetical protein